MDSTARQQVFEKYGEIWKHSIPRNYNSEWINFKEFNLLASESDFLEIHIAQIESLIDGFKRKIDFNSDPEEELDERPNLYDYWYYKQYLEYISNINALPIENKLESDFRAYLSDLGIKLLPEIIERYKGAKPKRLALMIHCLQDFGLLNNSIRAFKQGALTDAVKAAFNQDDLTRQALFYGIGRYESPDLSEQTELREEKIIISSYYEV